MASKSFNQLTMLLDLWRKDEKRKGDRGEKEKKVKNKKETKKIPSESDNNLVVVRVNTSESQLSISKKNVARLEPRDGAVVLTPQAIPLEKERERGKKEEGKNIDIKLIKVVAIPFFLFFLFLFFLFFLFILAYRFNRFVGAIRGVGVKGVSVAVGKKGRGEEKSKK